MKFLKVFILIMVVQTLTYLGSSQTHGEETADSGNEPPPTPISAFAEYFPEKTEPVKMPEIGGEFYEAGVPDTLDLAERAELAIGALTYPLDPSHDYEFIHFASLSPKYAAALPKLRVMCGSDLNLDIERNMMEAMVTKLSHDGLLYCPADTPGRQGGHRGYPKTSEPYANVFGNGLMLEAMMTWHERDPDPAWLDRLGKLAEGLGRIAIKKDDYAFYPEGRVAFEFSYLLKSGWKYDKEPGSEREGAESTVVGYQGHQIRGLSRWAAMNGDEQALETARKLVNFVLLPKFWEAGPDGIVGTERGFWSGHFHGRTLALRGVLAYARAAGDRRLMEFVRNAYEYGKYYGIPRIGWFPAWAIPGNANMTICETCAPADMTMLAVELTNLGLGDYWDDVDATVRNQLSEQQNRNKDLIVAAGIQNPVLSGCLGSFCGGGSVTAIPRKGMEGTFYPLNGAPCCTANASRALYAAWASIVRHVNGTSQVNLLLNRASPWLDVDSYLPYEGKVILKNKKSERIAVRIPGWVDVAEVRCRLNDQPIQGAPAGRYLLFEDLKPADTVTLEFPLKSDTATYTLNFGGSNTERYTFHFKGSTLMDISPRDQDVPYPIYQREHFKNNRAPMKTKQRYVSRIMLDL